MQNADHLVATRMEFFTVIFNITAAHPFQTQKENLVSGQQERLRILQSHILWTPTGFTKNTGQRAAYRSRDVHCRSQNRMRSRAILGYSKSWRVELSGILFCFSAAVSVGSQVSIFQGYKTITSLKRKIKRFQSLSDLRSANNIGIWAFI